MKIATVIPLEKGIFKSELTYFTAKEIKSGSIVSIPLRNKTGFGLVISCEDVKSAKTDIKDMSFSLKKIIEVKKHSIFKKEYMESTFLLCEYFSSQKNSISLLIPSVFMEKYDALEKMINLNEESKENFSEKAIKTEKLLFQSRFEDRISYYKTLIRGQFALKKSVYIVLPTEYDLQVFYDALSKGIENFTYLIHSGLNTKTILEKYDEMMNTSHGILIIGTAQFLSIPRNDIGTIIVEHESSNAYKIIPRPHFDLRIFAEIFASKIKAKLILSDTLLRYETEARRELDNFGEVYPLSFRTNFDGRMVEIMNPREENKNNNSFRIFSDLNIEKIENSLKAQKNVFIFSLRKGLATFTVCRDCNETVNCDKCLAPLVLYSSRDGKKRMFVCNRCKTEKDPNTRCSDCGSWNLMPLGIGTETVHEELKEHFPRAKILRLDKESIKNESSAHKIITEFEKNPGSILIGTEISFFYLKQKVDLSMIASFDSLWSIPNYKISEKIIQLLLSILSKTKDRLIIQTKNIHDSALLAIKSENLVSFVREELKDRKILGYPPFKRFIKISYYSDKNDSNHAKKYLEDQFKEYNPVIFSGFVSRSKNKFSTNALIKMDTKNWSLPVISNGSSIDNNLKNKLLSLSPNFEISVDPEDLF